MATTITVKTQHGNGGHWETDFEAPTGPRNLIAAAKEKGSGQSGVGGYRTVLEIGGVVIDRLQLDDLTMEKAKEICSDPTAYAPPEWVDEAPAKRPVGRPANIEGRKVNTYLDAESIATATALGHGNVSEGIRLALRRAAAPS